VAVLAPTVLHQPGHPGCRARRAAGISPPDRSERAAILDQRILGRRHPGVRRRSGSEYLRTLRVLGFRIRVIRSDSRLRVDSLDDAVGLRRLCERDQEVNLFCRFCRKGWRRRASQTVDREYLTNTPLLARCWYWRMSAGTLRPELAKRCEIGYRDRRHL